MSMPEDIQSGFLTYPLGVAVTLNDASVGKSTQENLQLVDMLS
jgi:hypothetical protein